MSESRVPLLEHFAKPVAQHGKTAKFLLEILQFHGCKRANLFTGSPAFLSDLQEPRQFMQCKSDGKSILHEPNPICRLQEVLTIAVGRATGMEKAQALIVAKRIGTEVREMGELRGSEITIEVFFFHKYGI